jgi:hypothetical protein
MSLGRGSFTFELRGGILAKGPEHGLPWRLDEAGTRHG